MAKKPTKPKIPDDQAVGCPKCGRKQPTVNTPGFLYRCDWCQMLFDGRNEDDGDYSDGDPSARLDRQEQNIIKDRNKRNKLW